MAKDELKKSSDTEKFRSSVRVRLLNDMTGNNPVFWEKLSKLPPRDYFDVMLKLLPYGFAKVPEPKPLPDKNVVLEERVRRVKASVQQGLPEGEYEYEDEEGE